MSAIRTAPSRRASRPVVEPAPEHGPFAVRVTYDDANVVIMLNRERGFRSESLIMRWLRRDRTQLRSPEELYAQYADLFAARRDAAMTRQSLAEVPHARP